MADNVAQQIKNLGSDIERLDMGLKDVAKSSKIMEDAIIASMRKGDASAKETIKSLRELQDALFGKFGNGKEIKIAVGIEKDKLKREIAEAENKIKGLKKQNPMRIYAEGTISTYKQQLAQLVDFEKQFARINQIVNGGKTNTGTLLGNARATEMNKVRTTMELINKQIDRRTQLEKTLSGLQARNGKSATFEGQRMTAKQLNDEIGKINQSIERYKRTLSSLGGRGRQALGSLGGDGTKTAIKDQMAAMRELYNLTKQYRQMQEKKRTGGIVNNQDLVDTRNRLREILSQMKQIEKEHPGSRKTAAMRLETERLRDRWREVNREVKPVKSSLDAMLPTLRRLASAFGVAFSVQGLVQFGKKLVETRGEFELQQVALRSILQNKQLADEIWDKTMQAALQSPFTAMQLTRYTKQLAAYRIETDKLFDTTKRLADVSAGLGVDMQRLILAYGQVKAANYLRASEIRQFTEAGVNILGELSDYFARTRGEMVSTAQVMEMVQKRMVKFEDVEAIFKHMTDEGGIFYNMQYVQSQTVKGQINKLHDAYDQMLNSIGQGNQGVLKNMVSIANNLVRNWREVAGTIQGIAWAFVFVQLGKIAIGIHRIGTEAITAGSKVSWLARQLGKLREKSKGYEFGKVFSKANVVLAAGAAVAFVTGKFIQHLNAVRQLNEKYNELSLRAYETQENLSGIQKTLSQNNQSIERLNKVSGKSKEQEEELANARKQNAEIVNKLKRDYPELADGMNIQKNGVVTLTSAISDYNEQLEYTILLNQLAKGNTWNDDFQTNVTEMTQSLQSAEQTLASYQTLAKSILLQMKNMDFGFREKSQAKGLKELLEGIIGLEKGDYEGLNKLLSGNRLSGYNRFTQTRSWRTAFQPILLDEHNIKATKKQLERSESVLYDLLKVSIRRDKEYMTEISKEWGGDIDKFIHNNAERIQKNVDDGKKDTFKAIREYGLQMGFAFKGAQDVFNQTLNRGNTSLFGGLGFRFFEYPGLGETSTDTETAEEKQAKIDAAWRRRINLLEEMKKRYDELSKSAYGYAKSNTTVRTEFEKSWGKIFGGVLSMNAVQFTSAAEMETAFETILAKAGAASDAVKEEIQKKADSYGARIPIDVQVRIREDFGRQMEEAFGNYELTLELQGLNIPPDMAKDLFPDLDMTTLGELQDIMDDFYQRQKKTDKDGNTYFDKDDLEQYRKWADKIDAEILKSRKEKVKQYGKFLEQEYSERAKLEMQHAKDVAFVTANVSDEGKRDNIIKNINEKFEKDLNELNWKSFKESAFYVEMMDDLSSIPMEYMRLMLGKIEEILQHPETLSPRALKEAINARQKIIEAQMDFDQIAVMRDSMKEIREAAKSPEEGGVGGDTWRQTKRNLDKEQKAQAEKLANIEKEIEKDKELQGQVKALEDAQLAVANASKALGKAVVTDLENAASEGGDATSVLNRYKNELEELRGEVSLFTQKQQNIGKEDEEGNIISITQTEKDINAGNEKRIEDLQRFIPLLEIYIKLLKEQANLENKLGEGVAAQGAGMTSTSIGQGIQGKQNKADEITERLTVIKRWQKAFVNFNNAFAKFNQNAVNMVDRIGALGSAAYDTFEALGGETDALTEGWKEFGNTVVSVITEALTMIPSLVAGIIGAGTAINAAMGIIGLIAEAIQLVITLIGALAKLHDAGYEKEIENQQKIIDNLQRAYERLEKAIEKTWATASYLRTYNEETQNLYEQIEALNKQLAAEEAKKNTDKDKLQDYKDRIQEAYDELEKLKQSQIEVFGGIGEEGYRSAAEGFVDAWKSAFLETGDGLQGLQDHFDEFLQDWFVKQATMRIAGNMLEPVFRQIDRAVDEYGTGGTSAMLSEIQNVREMAAAIFPDLSLALEDLAGMFGVGGEGSLSGLAAGIQGMTEEQANILEAYWNSVRMYTASIDMNVSRIAEMLGAGGAESNPMLQQMSLIAANVQATHQLLQSVTKSGHSQGGYGIKVFND